MSGPFLFRWRNFLPIPALLFILALQRSTRPPSPEVLEILRAAALALALAGLAIRSTVVGRIPEGTSTRSTSEICAVSLNTTGLYSVVRNPLYLGNLLLWLAAALLGGTLTGIVFAVLVFGFAYKRIIAAEEAFLRKEFGCEFEAWMRRTPAFLPRPSGYRKARQPFSVRAVVKREILTVAAFAIAVALIEWNRPDLSPNRTVYGVALRSLE